MTTDRLLTHAQIETHLRIDMSRLHRSCNYTIAPDGTRQSWLSDVARAAGLPASKVEHRLRLAQLAAAEKS